jgi:putative redox protein
MATAIKIKNIPTGFQSIISNGTHTIIGNETIESNGTDLGLDPTQLVLAGLAMCKVATVKNIARRNNWEVTDVNAHLKQTVGRNIDRSLEPVVSVSIDIEGNLSPEQESLLLQEADNCFIHRMLDAQWSIGTAEKTEKTKLGLTA